MNRTNLSTLPKRCSEWLSERLPARFPRRFPERLSIHRKLWRRRLIAGVIALTILVGVLWAGRAKAAECTPGACVLVASRLAEIDTGRSVLLNTAINTLLPGSTVDLNVLDWRGIASAELDLSLLIDILATDVGVAKPNELFELNVSLLQIIDASIEALQADGDLVTIQALNALKLGIPGLDGLTIPIGELLRIDFPLGNFVTTRINLLDLLTGSVQFMNYSNFFAIPEPITLGGGPGSPLAALGLAGIANEISIQTIVVEPPSLGCRPQGGEFSSAGVRHKVVVDLLELTPDSAPVVNALLTGLGLAGIADVDASLSLGQLELYVEVSRSEGVISLIDPDTPRVEVEISQGPLELYLGDLNDDLFFNRNRRIDPDQDLGFANIGDMSIELRPLPVLPGSDLAAVQLETDVLIRAHTTGRSNEVDRLIFTGPFPEYQTSRGNTAEISSIAGDLLDNAEFRTNLRASSGVTEPVLDLLGVGVDGVLATALGAAELVITDALDLFALEPLLGQLVDPLLDLLGINLAQTNISVLGAGSICNVGGFVYHDQNHSFQRESAEPGTGQPLFIKLVPFGEEQAVEVVAVDPSSGYYEFQNVHFGGHRIVLDDNADPNDTKASLPPGWVGTENGSGERLIILGTGNRPSQDFGLFHGSVISGQVFSDNGPEEAANNIQLDESESPLGNVLVQLRDGGDSSAGPLLASTRTDAEGRYRLWLPASATGTEVSVVEFTPSGYQSVGAALGDSAQAAGQYDFAAGQAADVIRFVPESGERYTGLNFADVPLSVFSPDNQAVAEAGAVVLHAHRFVAGTAGELQFVIAANNSAQRGDWYQNVFADTNCNGERDEGEALWREPVSVAAAEVVCVLLSDHISKDAQAGEASSIELQAILSVQTSSGVLQESVNVTDRSQIAVAGAAGVTLFKSADKQQAAPGELITYELRYRNDGQQPIEQVLINDSAPAFTTYQQAECVPPLPAGLTDCQVEQNGQRGVRWRFEGALQPGQEGLVRYQVRLQP